MIVSIYVIDSQAPLEKQDQLYSKRITMVKQTHEYACLFFIIIAC